MKYLGLDVHGKATVFCLLNAEGEVVERGSLPTTAPDLTKLIQRLSSIDTLLCGQEVGTMTHFVHDVVTSAGAKILSFNAQHLRMRARAVPAAIGAARAEALDRPLRQKFCHGDRGEIRNCECQVRDNDRRRYRERKDRTRGPAVAGCSVTAA